MNRKKMTLFNYVNGVFLLLLVIVCILPILHVIALSLSERIEAVAGNVTFYPIGFTLEAYRYVMEDSQFWTSLRVTLTRVLIGVPTNILLVVMTAYPLSKANSRFHARTFFSWLFVITMLFGGGTIPTYIVISKLGLMNTIWALTLPGAMNVSYMILIMNFFRGIPTEIEDAAVIDGANQLQILFRVYLPMSMPSLATIILFATVANWNCWMDGYMYMNTPDKYPLQTYLATILMESKNNVETLMTPEQLIRMAKVSEKTIEAAQIFLAALPIMCVYPFLQKYYTKGTLPLTADKRANKKIYAEAFLKNAKHAADSTAALRKELADTCTLVDDPAQADFALLFVSPSSGEYFNATPGYLELDICEDKTVCNVDVNGKSMADTHTETTLHGGKRLSEIAASVHANGGKVITNVNITLAWQLGNVEPLCDVLLAGFDTYRSATLDVIFGCFAPTGKLPLTLPRGDAVLAVNADGVCISPNDVPGYDKDRYMPDFLKDENGKAYAYRDAAGNYYEYGFGLEG